MELLGGHVRDMFYFGEEDGKGLLAFEAFGDVSVVELEEAVEGHVLLASGEVDDEGGGDVAEGVEFVRLAEVEHIPDQTLLVSDFPVELEVVEAEAVLPQSVVLEPERILRPLEKQHSLRARRFGQIFALVESPPHPSWLFPLPRK